VVDLSRFAYRARRPLRPRLLSTRNLEPHYREDMIIQAYAQLKPRVPEATLTIAGYGSEETRLRLLVRSAGLNDVRFIGRVEPEDMPRVYDEADIFLNASVVDNQPVSILEAFASGMPVVSTPTGDIAALVRHHDTGLLVPPFDPGAIAHAIAWLLANPDRAAGFAERAHASTSKYTWPAVRDAWAAMYRAPSHDTVIDSWLTNRHSH
jgi:glycosyltransferase involved in cell wall biosynthesis